MTSQACRGRSFRVETFFFLTLVNFEGHSKCAEFGKIRATFKESKCGFFTHVGGAIELIDYFFIIKKRLSLV